MLPPLRGLEVAVLDIETTGLFPRRNDRIVEIAVLRGRVGEEPSRVYTTLVNPKRDIGPTRIHGVRAQDVLDAPTFEEIAGDVVDALAGAVVAGHNVTFDVGFVREEFERLGCEVARTDPLCTMRLGRHLRLTPPGRSLTDHCACLGIEHTEQHAAERDAQATRRLLNAYLALAEARSIRALEDLGYEVSFFPPIKSGRLARCGRTHPRGAAAPAPAPRSFLAELVHRLGQDATATPTPELAEYFELLDRVLEDGVVTETEADGLLELAETAGISRKAIATAHHTYLEALASAALRDARVTENELRELQSVAALLGLDRAAVDQALAAAGADALMPEAAAAIGIESELKGKTVCFTGELLCCFRGSPISRELAEYLATRAGLIPVKSVTRNLDVLVVADPHTMSSKAKRAREYGTRIMTEQAFWRALGISVE